MTEAVQYVSGIVPSTLVSLLRMRAEQQPDDAAYTFVSDESCREEITYAELDKRARTVGRQLSSLQVHGKPVMLLCPAGIEFISALFGCMYAGAIAVPAPLPDSLRSERCLSRFAAIIRDAAPCAALTTAAAYAAISSLCGPSPGLSGLQMVAIDNIAAGGEEIWEPGPADAESIAMLHYTSGAVSTPKGVALTHNNLISNCELVFRLFGHSQENRSVMWLPPDQGMGFIGGIIQPLCGGFPATLMAPADVLERPLRWLQEISGTHTTVSGGPNFAYDLCVRKTTEKERLRLDLSGWQVAFNTSAPVQAEMMEQFARAFEPAGFRREAFHPCYGFAEATNLVTGGIAWSRRRAQSFDGAALQHGEAIPCAADGSSPRLVSCGYAPVDHCRVVIVDPVTRMECTAGQVGEIWVSGSSVARSYWRRPDETRKVFGARLAGTADVPFVRSGDLGFMLDHELFVTGRTKGPAAVGGDCYGGNDITDDADMPTWLSRHGDRLSSWQHSLWFLREIDPGTAGHRVAMALLFHGELDISALEYAAHVVVARRAASFQCCDEVPGSRNIGRCRAWLEEARDIDEEEFPMWLESSAHEPFDGTRGPLRLHLYRRGADETVVLVVAHHVIADVWSIAALVRELEVLYGERKSDTAELVRQYCWIGGSRVSAPAPVAADPAAPPVCLRPWRGGHHQPLEPPEGIESCTGSISICAGPERTEPVPIT